MTNNLIMSSDFLDSNEKEEIKKSNLNSSNRLEGASDQWYFSDSRYLTCSHLKLLKNNGPTYLLEYLKGNIKSKESDAFKIGSAFHMRVLEPHLFDKTYIVFDDTEICKEIGGKMPRATNKYKEHYAQFLDVNNGLIILSIDEFEQIDSMAKSVLNHLQSKELVKSCTYFESVFTNTIQGIEFKSKVDGLSANNYFIDLKSISVSPTSDNVRHEFYKRDYDMQAAIYADVTGINNPWYIFVEKTYPYTIGIYEISQETLESGRKKYLQYLDLYKATVKNANFESEKFVFMGIL